MLQVIMKLLTLMMKIIKKYIMITTSQGCHFISDFLTNHKNENYNLADIQELINNKNKAQYVHSLKIVKRITDDSQIQEVLAKETYYINKPKHVNNLKEIFRNTAPNSVENYGDIKALMLNDIKKLIEIFDEKKAVEIKNELEKYLKLLKHKRNEYTNDKDFNTWKEKQDINRSKVHKIKWPDDAFAFVEEYKRNHEK